MTGLNQNQALLSVNQHLIPEDRMIDGRTEKDMLNFLTNFSGLINFYDNTNTINGTWAPFLLKGPVFLLASISSTPFSDIHQLYLSSYKELESIVNSTERQDHVKAHFSRFFDQLFEVFIRIERWSWYMTNNDTEYSLRSYVLHQIDTNFAETFWALLSLHTSLGMHFGRFKGQNANDYLLELSKVVLPNDGITVTNTNQLAFHEKVWWQNKDKSPYQEVLDIPMGDVSNEQLLEMMKREGDELFTFFKTTIDQASTDFETMSADKDGYPDTLLLRTFVNLLSSYQDQLNGISKRYLHFYYNDILKQAKQGAVADSVFLSAVLAKPDSAFTLPQGTLFDAGTDENQEPIYFESTEDVSLNPCSIASAYTLMRYPDEPACSLFLQSIADPSTVSLSEDGTVQSWNTFGSSVPNTENQVSMGCAFASPLLYLTEGSREVYLTIEFVNNAVIDDFSNATYYFSTASDWLNITPKELIQIDESSIEFKFKIKADKDPIVPFDDEVDGYTADWPLFKIVFSSFPDVENPPTMKTLTIETKVWEMNTFQLANDQGALSTKAAFLPFGSTAELSSNFFIGNTEIFSKPLTDLTIAVDWSTLPGNFLDYYQQYNNFIHLQKDPPKGNEEKKSGGFFNTMLNAVKAVGNSILTVVKTIAKSLKKIVTAILPICDYKPPQNQPDPFNNGCFQVQFDLLQNGAWNPFDLSCTSDESNRLPLGNDTLADRSSYLFYQASTDLTALDSESSFIYPPVTPPTDDPSIIWANPGDCDPYIQKEDALTYSETSKYGFMRLSLSNPPEGFGTSTYPNVVTYYAMQKALLIAKKCPIPSALDQAVNLPYLLKAEGLTAQYTATQTYDFTRPERDKPIQFFLYSPFANYLLYDSTKNIETQFDVSITSIADDQKIIYGVPMYPAFKASGSLFIELEGLVVPNEVNLFFELSRKVNDSSQGNTVDYFYLANTGWAGLTVISDTTEDFICSGIINSNVPNDIAYGNYTMPGENSWISINAYGDPASFAETAYLSPNSLLTTRTGISSYSGSEAPQIPQNTITQPDTAVPEISTISQPFASFGGQMRETRMQMNERVSTRLKSKGRVSTSEDYFRIIKENFDSIYYSKTYVERGDTTTYVYLVREFDSPLQTNAFIPLVSECTESQVQEYLISRSSSFANIKVSNFDLERVRVMAEITIDSGYEFDGVKSDVIQQLNLYLSPWIVSPTEQVDIDEEITDSQVAMFIQTIPGIASVNSVEFCVYKSNSSDLIASVSDTITPGSSSLFVSYMNHYIYLPNE